MVVHLARPEVRNAIDHQMVTELHEVCDLLERDPRVLLLAGKGGNFAAGADIAQLRERRRDDALRGINSALFDRIHRLPMPVIGLLDGFALGGGAELAYACDFRIGTPRLRIGNPEPGLGILAAAGATWRLKELVGEPVAKEILLAGRVLDADEALVPAAAQRDRRARCAARGRAQLGRPHRPAGRRLPCDSPRRPSTHLVTHTPTSTT